MKATPKQAANMHFLSKDGALALFGKAASRELNMSGEEFRRAWDAGEFDEDFGRRPGVVDVYMLFLLVRG